MSDEDTCRRCGAEALEEEEETGSLICGECGLVLEERDRFVVDKEFTAAGGLSGRFVADEDAQALSQDPATSRAAQRFRDELTRVAGVLGVNELIPSALRVYRWAQQRGFAEREKTRPLACAALYLVCRQRRTSHLLLDLAETQGCNAFRLGAVYVRLVHALGLASAVPVVDPAVFLPRFAQRLQLGDSAASVENLALRLVCRMRRDWLTTGRSPAGICGAALHMACRMIGVERSLTEVVEVVRVCHKTIRSRMNEFMATPSAQLSLAEFDVVDLAEEGLPPCFDASQSQWAAMEAELLQTVGLASLRALDGEGENDPADEAARRLRQDAEEAEEEREEQEEQSEELEFYEERPSRRNDRREADSEGKGDDGGEQEESLSEMDSEEAAEFIQTNAVLLRHRRHHWMNLFGAHIEEREQRRALAADEDLRNNQRKRARTRGRRKVITSTRRADQDNTVKASRKERPDAQIIEPRINENDSPVQSILENIQEEARLNPITKINMDILRDIFK